MGGIITSLTPCPVVAYRFALADDYPGSSTYLDASLAWVNEFPVNYDLTALPWYNYVYGLYSTAGLSAPDEISFGVGYPSTIIGTFSDNSDIQSACFITTSDGVNSAFASQAYPSGALASEDVGGVAYLVYGAWSTPSAPDVIYQVVCTGVLDIGEDCPAPCSGATLFLPAPPIDVATDGSGEASYWAFISYYEYQYNFLEQLFLDSPNQFPAGFTWPPPTCNAPTGDPFFGGDP